MSYYTLTNIILIVTILLWLSYRLIGKLFGCPKCGSLRRRHLGQDYGDPYPTVECKSCKHEYYCSLD